MIRLKKIVRSTAWGLLLFATVAFVEFRRSQRVCQRLVVRVEQTDEHHFIDRDDIRLLVTHQQMGPLEGTRLRNIDMKMLEKNVATNNYVQHVDVFHDLVGNVIVQARQNRPIARILQPKAADVYLGADGRLLPLSERFTARVVLLSGEYVPALLKTNVAEDSVGAQVLELVRYIERDDFWQAQIAQIDMNQQKNITLYPQIGKQRIDFGKADHLSEKFDKLAVFYDQILPRRGWNHYQQVSLKYENQIVCH